MTTNKKPPTPEEFITQIEYDGYSRECGQIHFGDYYTALYAENQRLEAKLKDKALCGLCGHVKGSHNENGCCWDDPCPYECKQFRIGILLSDNEPPLDILRDALAKQTALVERAKNLLIVSIPKAFVTHATNWYRNRDQWLDDAGGE